MSFIAIDADLAAAACRAVDALALWQTRITDESGRMLTLTLQTQMVLEKAG